MNEEILTNSLYKQLVEIISDTNGVSLNDTLELLSYSQEIKVNPQLDKSTQEFRRLLNGFQQDEVDISTLLRHSVSQALFQFFKTFPLKYHEDHIHLTGSLTADFLYPYLEKLLSSKDAKIYEQKISQAYGKLYKGIKNVSDVDHLIRLQEGEQFMTYLKILYLPKLVLTNRLMHKKAAYHMASELYNNYNVGNIRLKFTLSRATNIENEKIPGIEQITETDVVLGLNDGFKDFQKEHPDFDYVLSPCFRKEADFFDGEHFESKKDHFNHQVDQLLNIIKKFPELKDKLVEVDTVGNEKELYRKRHFEEMKQGLRKLQLNGMRIRSHHGETWKTLKKGIQSVDNSMNIWHIDTLEHGLSLGINPNYYFHRLYQRIIDLNAVKIPILKNTSEYLELLDMQWNDPKVKEKLLKGQVLTEKEKEIFLKTKFHTATEVEHYQHDVLNRVIQKNVSLVALPTSNMKLTGSFPDYKDHPFSWWEKKGVRLGVGTDNYITLDTNYIEEMLKILYSDPDNLKITKLLMICTKENRRAYIGHLLWEMRKKLKCE
ncbi:MAG: hypothetical protein H6622_12155 [Halobacteriovoraceae bacterium]|nr:hypothetical protein [Halobacteriovoraceae bacterium]